ncbi:uncharacterized protein LOC107397509 [Tribolium castaneum]|uniref:uncharacterized protein LOC107397509 n=1 Tax=Tribolium castaneum TaxID=7070 RepID=UPI00077DEA5B|nr:PREDICTED: uncharacterized protein LOC107397509 [Tribolium castaneum]|eukprot:XP_015833339.1 PREDICTED: uncharacterized protein LOC107397509 [Tribolium castaneum]
MSSLPKLANLRLKSLTIRRKKDEPEENPVEKLLKPIKTLEPDTSDESDFSEISDVFEEFHKNSYLKRRSLSKHEADILTMSEFTDDFKKTMSQIRNDLDNCDELFLDSGKTYDEPKIHPQVSLKEDETTSIPTLSELQKRKSSDSSTSSITWHLLAVNRANKKFEITPPAYNAFNQTEPHWLERESVSWEKLEKATLKCEEWLEQCL